MHVSVCLTKAARAGCRIPGLLSSDSSKITLGLNLASRDAAWRQLACMCLGLCALQGRRHLEQLRLVAEAWGAYTEDVGRGGATCTTRS